MAQYQRSFGRTSHSFVNEETIKQLKQGASKRFRTVQRAKPLNVKYQGINKQGQVMFKTTSGTTPGKFWKQLIRLDDLDFILKDVTPKDSDLDIVRAALKGNISVWCEDPSFLYFGWKRIAFKRSYGIEREDRDPTRRNPTEDGTTCKHLYAVMTVLPFHAAVLVRDLRKKGFLTPAYRLDKKKPKK